MNDDEIKNTIKAYMKYFDEVIDCFTQDFGGHPIPEEAKAENELRSNAPENVVYFDDYKLRKNDRR